MTPSATPAMDAVQDGLWVVEGGVVSFYGAPYPTRAVLARLSDGGLWVWSPIALTPDLRAAVDRLGPVRHLVSPNKLHHLFLAQWSQAYPEAQLWAPRSLIRKRRDLVFAGALGDDPPAAWGGAFDQAWFRGSIMLDEVVFFHRASSTALVCDLIQAFSARVLREQWGFWGPIARLDGITDDDPGAPREWRLSFLNRAPARRARDKTLAWDPRRVVIAHGDWPRDNGRAFLARALRWLW